MEQDMLLTMQGHAIVADSNGQWFVVWDYDAEAGKYIGFNVMAQTLLDPAEITPMYTSNMEDALTPPE